MSFFKFRSSPTVRLVKKIINPPLNTHPPSRPAAAPANAAPVPPAQEQLSSSQINREPSADAEPDLKPSSESMADGSLAEHQTHFALSRIADTEETTMANTKPIASLKSPVKSSINPSSGDISSTGDSSDSSLQWLFTFTDLLHKAPDLEALLETVVTQVYQHFQVDRVLICRFHANDHGVVLAEAVADGFTPSLNEILPAIAFGATTAEQGQRLVTVVHNAAETLLTPYQQQLLERFQVKSSLSIPILLEQSWGVLVVQQCAEPRQWQAVDLSLLHKVATELRLNLQPAEERRRRARRSKQTKILARVIQKIHQPMDVQNVFQTTTQELQQSLQCDRVAVYRFNDDWSGQFVAESVNLQWVPLVNPNVRLVWQDTYLQETQGGRYQNGETLAVDDIYNAGYRDCHIELLEQFQAKAYAIAPIISGNQLWGLLAAYQNNGPRHWEEEEVEFLAQIGYQFGVALQQATYVEALQAQSVQINKIAERERLILKIVNRMRQTFDLNRVFTTTSREVRRFLKADRVAIYKFDPDSNYSSGVTVAEDVEAGFPSVLSLSVTDHCFGERYVEEYQKGRIWMVTDIENSDLQDCFVELLTPFEAKATLVVPLLKGEAVWGLFYIHQCSEPREWQEEEVDFTKQVAAQLNIALQQGEYVAQLQQQSKRLAEAAEQESLINKTVDRIRQSLDLEQAFRVTSREIRNFLNVDRVAIYKFAPESGHSMGVTIAEDVRPGYTSALDVPVTDHCFSEGFAKEYQQGRVCAIADVYNAGLKECYINVLSQFQVRANMAVPLLKGDELWGLFCIHQCSGPRQWQEAEVEFTKRIAAQLNIAIQQGEYVEQLRQQSDQLAAAAKRDKAAKEMLQQEVIQLLSAVRPALEGDLTVRAPVTDNEVGTVADAYNSTLSSLRQIILQVQTASRQVTETSQTSEAAISDLASLAREQFLSLTQALEQIQAMVHSTEAVEANAQEVQIAVQQANRTVLSGDAAIDRTVGEMQEIRGTVAETNKRLKQLSESSQKISKVVNLIRNFTTQTQLLALNASIEATRAGEYGRGFAVVADEVRSLARQSAEAATEIEQLVQDIQGSTAEVSIAMERGIEQVASGTHVVKEARQSFTAIADATAQISELVGGITLSTQNQTQQCQSVTQTMSEVAEIANTTLENSVAISAAIKELLTMAQDLENRSAQFKVH